MSLITEFDWHYTRFTSTKRHSGLPESFYSSQASLNSAWEKLDKIFGNPVHVSKAHINKIRSHAHIDSKDTGGILNFSNVLNAALADMNAMENTQLLDSDENIRAAIVKLPHELIASWERHCVSKFQDTEPISFQELVEFVERQALARDNPRYGHDEIFKEKSKDKADDTHTKNSKTRMTGNQMTYRQNTTLTTNANASHANSQDFSDSASMGSCAFCQLKNHTLKDCYSIQMTGSATKKNFFYANNMCTRCGEHRCKDQDHQCLPNIKCRVCSSTSHITAFHPNKENVVDRQGQHTNTSPQKPSWHGGQSSTRTSPKSNQYSGNNNNTSDATKSTTKTGVSNKIDHISTKEQNTPMDFCHIVPARVYSLKDPSNKKLVYVDADGESSTCWVATWSAEKQGWIGPETTQKKCFCQQYLLTMQMSKLHQKYSWQWMILSWKAWMAKRRLCCQRAMPQEGYLSPTEAFLQRKLLGSSAI